MKATYAMLRIGAPKKKKKKAFKPVSYTAEAIIKFLENAGLKHYSVSRLKNQHFRQPTLEVMAKTLRMLQHFQHDGDVSWTANMAWALGVSERRITVLDYARAKMVMKNNGIREKDEAAPCVAYVRYAQRFLDTFGATEES